MKRFYFSLLCLFSSFVSFGATKQMETLDRGIVAVKTSSGVFVSWRFLGTDNKTDAFNIYRDGTKLNSSPLTSVTNYTDAGGSTSSTYTIKRVVDGTETESASSKEVWDSFCKSVQLQRPATGSTGCTYTPNDMSAGDLDGDGEYELVVKWDPSNSKDNSQSGTTGNVYLDGYKLDGTFLWRIDLGVNIRAGAHYTQFQVYDFDGDGYAEVACKTAPGTIDGTGKAVLMDSDVATSDYRNSKGYILSGSEYLTIFNGQTGAEINTVSYNPARGTVSSWGDSYGNRCDRFLACTAYLDGVHPSLVVCRGYYTRSTLTAYDYKNGKLVQKWYHNSATKGSGAYAQGFHNLSVADVDKDGYDEIVYGSATIDHDGSLYSRTGYGHGDAMHVSKMVAGDDDYYGWFVHEETSSAYGYELRNLRTNTVVFGAKTGTDVGRGCAADIDATNPGFELWGYGYDVFNTSGTVISSSRPSINFRIYWDGDLQDEILDNTTISKWNSSTKKAATLEELSAYNYSASCNTTKATPCLSADLFGDWREEVILYNSNDPSKINIFTTTIPSDYRLVTLMHDIVYREGIAWQNTAYNQPPHLSYYIGDGIDNVSMPDIYTVGDISTADPTLTLVSGSEKQTVETGASMTAIKYAWTDASNVNVVWSPYAPEGVSVSVDNANKTVIISGEPSISGVYTYTITTVSRAENQASATGTLTFGDGSYPDAKIQKQGGGSSRQNINSGESIASYNYQWWYAETVEVTWTPSAPNGIDVIIDDEAGKVYFSGTPSSCGKYEFTVTTRGNLGATATSSGYINVVGTSHVFVCDTTNGDWNDTSYWLDESIPTDCDTATIRSGEVNVSSDIRAVTYVEDGGTFRVRTNIAVKEIHFLGGKLKSYTSNPQFRMTAVKMTVDGDMTIQVGSVDTSEFKLSGTVAGTGNLNKTSVGILTQNADFSDYSGRWTLSEGTINLTNTNGLGNNGIDLVKGKLMVSASNQTGSITMANGTTLELSSADLTVDYATLGETKLKKGTYTAQDYPDFITGTGSLIVMYGYEETGVAEILNINDCTINPNPASTVATLIIGTECSGTIQVADALGRVVLSDSFADTDTVDINVSGLPEGVYVVKLIAESKMVALKLVVR